MDCPIGSVGFSQSQEKKGERWSSVSTYRKLCRELGNLGWRMGTVGQRGGKQLRAGSRGFDCQPRHWNFPGQWVPGGSRDYSSLSLPTTIHGELLPG